MIRLAQLYTGGVGSEIVRRCAGHPELELVAVMVHADAKAGRDSGELVGAAPERHRHDAAPRRRARGATGRGHPLRVDVRPRPDHRAAARGGQRVHGHRRLLPAGHARLRPDRRRRARRRRVVQCGRQHPRSHQRRVADVRHRLHGSHPPDPRPAVERRVDVPVGRADPVARHRQGRRRRAGVRGDVRRALHQCDPPVGADDRRRSRRWSSPTACSRRSAPWWPRTS